MARCVEDAGRRCRRWTVTAWASPCRTIGHLDGDGDVGVDPEEVDVEDVAAHRVALQLLHDDEVALGPVDVEVDQGVEAGVGDEGGAQLAPLRRRRTAGPCRARRRWRAPCRSARRRPLERLPVVRPVSAWRVISAIGGSYF